MRHFRFFLLGLFLSVFTSSVVTAQTKVIAKLKENIQSAVTNEQRLTAIFNLCELGYSLHPDTLMLYAEKAKQISLAQKNLHNQVRAMYYQSAALTTKGLIDSSLSMARDCLALLTDKENDPVLLANILNQKGRCYMRKNQYKEAVDMGYQVINEAEKGKDTLLQMKGKTLIGWAYLEMGQQKNALSWHLKALHTTNDTLVLEKYGILFANLALNYNSLGKADSGFYYINKAILYSRRNENLFALSNSLAIHSQLLITAGENKLAEAPLKEMVEIRKLIGDPFYIISDMSQLSLYYAHNGQPEKGIALCKEGIAIAQQYKLDTKLFFLYRTLAENYSAMGDTIMYAQTLEKIINLKDSVYLKNSVEALAEIQTRYDLQKKENLIIRQKLDITKKNYLFYGLLLLAFFAAVIAALLFRGYKKREKIKMLQMQQEEKRMTAEAVLRAEEKERKRIAADLHDNLGAYAATIASNLDHILITEKEHSNLIALQELRNNSQSIVAQLSDTIWALNKDALVLTALSDRIKLFLQRLRPSYPNINIEVTENIAEDQLLSPSQAFNLFQIVQEAVINSLRHSGCKQVIVKVESSGQWKISIEDDGKGMTVKTNNTGGGNGLHNMRNRAAANGWKIDWLKREPMGTLVIIEPTTD